MASYETGSARKVSRTLSSWGYVTPVRPVLLIHFSATWQVIFVPALWGQLSSCLADILQYISSDPPKRVGFRRSDRHRRSLLYSFFSLRLALAIVDRSHEFPTRPHIRSGGDAFRFALWPLSCHGCGRPQRPRDRGRLTLIVQF
jgi:hypothetical protein